jgi:succinyl-CoA synthetase beta subunit
VALTLSSAEEVRREGARLLRVPGCTALLVEEYVRGERELVCGFLRDPSFGPTIMFGIGGILTEVINDVAFRLAPMDEIDINDLLEGIRSKKILEEYRGQKPADRESLKSIILALNNIGTNYEEISQIDINPIKIKQDGSLIAVDALVVLDPT